MLSTITGSLPQDISVKISLAFQQKKELVSSLHSLIHCFLHVAMEALEEISSFFFLLTLQILPFCVFVYLLLFLNPHIRIYLFIRVGGWRGEKHCLPYVLQPESTHNVLIHGMTLQTTEPPSQGCLSCVFVSPLFLLLSEANTVFLKF